MVGLDLSDAEGAVHIPSIDLTGNGMVYQNAAKSSPGFAPLGPELVTLDELERIGELRLTLSIDGVVVQDGRPDDLLFSTEEIISRLSQRILLRAGDVILTGSPGQVPGRPLTPLVHGNELVAVIEGVGRQTHTIIHDRGLVEMP